MTPSPYAPPRAPIAEAGTVDVKQGEALPLCCLKCGSTTGVAPRPKKLLVLGRARVATLAAALIGGVTVAVVPTPETRMVVFLALAGIAFVVRRVVYPGIDLPVALCATCAERWTAGVRWSKIFRGGIVGFAAASTLLTILGAAPLLVLLVALGVFGSTLGLFLVRMRSRIVVAKQVKGDVVTLALVHPDAVATINSGRA